MLKLSFAKLRQGRNRSGRNRSGRRGMPAGQEGLPRLVRHLLIHCAMGTFLGAGFGALLIMSNIAGLADLLETSENPALPIAMLMVGCALTFGSAVMGASIWSLESDDTDS